MSQSLKEAETLDNMLSRSAVGQKLTSYCSFSGKQVDGEADGPEDFHVVIVDNGRSNASWHAIRAKSCNAFAVARVSMSARFIGISVVMATAQSDPGPIGAVLSPVLDGYEKFGDLPFASSLCAACTETCPVRIPLHELLIPLKHREVMMDKLKMDHSFNDKIMKMVGVGTSAPVLFNMALDMDHAMMGVLATKDSRQRGK